CTVSRASLNCLLGASFSPLPGVCWDFPTAVPGTFPVIAMAGAVNGTKTGMKSSSTELLTAFTSFRGREGYLPHIKPEAGLPSSILMVAPTTLGHSLLAKFPAAEPRHPRSRIPTESNTNQLVL